MEPSGNPAKKYAKEMRSTNIQAVFCFCPKFHHVVTEEKKGAANPKMAKSCHNFKEKKKAEFTRFRP
jgi:hypothetical protein